MKQVYPTTIQSGAAQTGNYILMLLEPEDNRQMPIIIGQSEAQGILLAKQHVATRRPLTHQLMVNTLEAYGLSENDIKPVYQSFGDSADSLKDGKIDAAFIVAGAPTNAITDLATAGNVYLVAIDKEHSDKLLAASPFYSTYTIPAGTY